MRRHRHTLAFCVLWLAGLRAPVHAHIIGDPSHDGAAGHYDRSVRPPALPTALSAEVWTKEAMLLALRGPVSVSPAASEAGARVGMPDAVAGMVALFRPFAPRVKTRWDAQFFYVESDAMPDHCMMVGITAWQQQVPLPQPYTGDNAWRLPLHPVIAKSPLSAKTHFFRGAIALAVNGVPIFNPIKNDGRTDTLLAGELDEFGGHAGRADDYHYHIAPLHLEKSVGKGKPVAYALDGYPIYGLTDPDGSAPAGLDGFNGHTTATLGYHYHASKSYPYLNGGFRGEVVERDGQVDPQPRARGVRPATAPLRGAKITGFTSPRPGSYALRYQVGAETRAVNYTLKDDGSVRFDHVDGNGQVTTEIGRPGADRGPGGGRGPGREGGPDAAAGGGPRPPGNGPGAGDRRPAAGGGPRPPGNGPDGDRPAPDGPRGPDPNDPNRQPWLKVHAPEMDTNHDGSLTRAELTAEVEKTFSGYDRNGDDRLTRDEYEGPGGVRSAMGGFVKQHAQEIDADNDGILTRAELTAVVTRMFTKGDLNGDGTITPDEFAKMTAAGGRRGTAPNAVGRAPDGNAPGRPGGGGAGAPPLPRPRGGGDRRQGSGQFRTEVPPHPVDLILGRPTNRSVVLSVLCYQEAEGLVAYGTQRGEYSHQTPRRSFPTGKPVEVLLDQLEPGIRYYYQFRSRSPGATAFTPRPEATFVTARPPGSTFTFTVQADSHLDERVNPPLYEQTVTNAAADRPDFHIDLGDTFMTGKHQGDRGEATRQYLAQRYYLGLIGRSSPVFLVLGNHDGEKGDRRDSEEASTWANGTRKQYFPNPTPDDFYSGNTTRHPTAGLLQDYYAWEWGDALFVVLDPFWFSTVGRRDADSNWNRSLGLEQYQWLKRTLQGSRAKFKFVFIHHLVGGATPEGRGGAEASRFYEWGGKNQDGSDGFQVHRPGWPAPIHDLLVQNRVSVVFHGHDHLFAKQDRDGIVYQAVPQPGNPGSGSAPRDAADYSYVNGTILGSPGYMRIKVAGSQATVEFVRSCLPQDEMAGRKNGQVVASYTLTAAPQHPRSSP